jgi:hypothetical protein
MRPSFSVRFSTCPHVIQEPPAGTGELCVSGFPFQSVGIRDLKGLDRMMMSGKKS